MPSRIGLIVWGTVMVVLCLAAIEVVRTQLWSHDRRTKLAKGEIERNDIGSR